MRNEIAIQEIESIDYFLQNHTNDYSESTHTALMMAIEALQEQKVGKWVKDRYCSNCEWSNEDVYFTSGWTGNYCPNCGTKMEGADNGNK